MMAVAEWRSLANDLVSTCLDIFAKAQVRKMERNYRDTQFIGLTLLARTLSNLKARSFCSTIAG
jgi:hypothetical protein